MRWIVSLLVNSVVLIAVSGLLKGLHPTLLCSKYTNCNHCEYYLGCFKCVCKTVLILITLPITVVTFGFFLIVINAITLKITDSLLGMLSI